MDRLHGEYAGEVLGFSGKLNRVESVAREGLRRHEKTFAWAKENQDLLLKKAAWAIPQTSEEIVLDFDVMEETGLFHDRCDCCATIPLYKLVEGDKRGIRLNTLEGLKKIVSNLRERFGQEIPIVVRGDSALHREAVMAWCEANEITYCFGVEPYSD